ncbi:hypothetical protein TSUD_333630 [Trifolium subterraneum]|uniref:Argonaute linker 1 domain-containing protein n=1 Tax=Trifolium subterraneum TaxID=3900 RepID=A0A2Z6NAI7_TRISU|nr:hypothetical protein TSUD_333630 [Trifolium subterraneum]
MELTFAAVPSFPITKSETSDRNSCSFSFVRHNKFVQLSFSSTCFRHSNKNPLFKVLSAERDHVQVVEGSCVDEIYDALVRRILPPASVSLNPNYKFFVGLAGPPGAGKSTIAHEVANRINKLWPEKASSFDSQVRPPDVAIVIPMDGFHLYRSELDAMKYNVALYYEDGRPVEGKGAGRKILDRVQETYNSELNGKDISYDGEKTVFTIGSLAQNKHEFKVVLEDVASNKNNGNCSPEGNGSPNEADRKRIKKSYRPKRVLDIILRQHAAKPGCLLVRQNFFHNAPKNFTDVGGGVLGCRGLHSSFRTTQSGLSLNIVVATTMIVHPGPYSAELPCINVGKPKRPTYVPIELCSLRSTTAISVAAPICYAHLAAFQRSTTAISVVAPICYAHLVAFQNPEEAHARRGAPWTFNPMRLLTCLKNLRVHGSVYAPSFDHGVGDPVEDDIFVSLQFVDIDIDKAMWRVLKRHISTGKPRDIAKQRVENNDRLNAELIMKSKKNADIIINILINFALVTKPTTRHQNTTRMKDEDEAGREQVRRASLASVLALLHGSWC